MGANEPVLRCVNVVDTKSEGREPEFSSLICVGTPGLEPGTSAKSYLVSMCRIA